MSCKHEYEPHPDKKNYRKFKKCIKCGNVKYRDIFTIKENKYLNDPANGETKTGE